MNDVAKELIFSLEDSFSELEGRVDLLQDIEVLMSQLRDSVDQATHRGVQRHWHHQHHRELRILSELFRYVTNDIVTSTEKTSKIKEDLVKLVYASGSSDSESTTEQTDENLQQSLKKEKGNAS
ncbi:hypothetical protein ACQKK5_19190 [Brevibacillus panacihumi]|uniref:hypothetical protein n=1 Tax=Brevibacillus panacihumi TaxID=497735 RepID=UPI003D086AE2